MLSADYHVTIIVFGVQDNESDMGSQTNWALQRVGKVLEGAGSSPAEVLAATLFVTSAGECPDTLPVTHTHTYIQTYIHTNDTLYLLT